MYMESMLVVNDDMLLLHDVIITCVLVFSTTFKFKKITVTRIARNRIGRQVTRKNARKQKVNMIRVQ